MDASTPTSPKVVNKHVASPPQRVVHPINLTETMSTAKGQLNYHTGPEVQQFGHVAVGDGTPICDVRDGRIYTHGASVSPQQPRPAELQGRVVSHDVGALDASRQPGAQPDELHSAKQHHGPEHQRSSPTVGHSSHHHAHHTADGAAVSDPAKDFVHDGTTYATGASNEPYTDSGEQQRPGLATRVKEALPFTHEHKEKKEREGDLAVYT